jgi:hypothetical protein
LFRSPGFNGENGKIPIFPKKISPEQLKIAIRVYSVQTNTVKYNYGKLQKKIQRVFKNFSGAESGKFHVCQNSEYISENNTYG